MTRGIHRFSGRSNFLTTAFPCTFTGHPALALDRTHRLSIRALVAEPWQRQAYATEGAVLSPGEYSGERIIQVWFGWGRAFQCGLGAAIPMDSLAYISVRLDDHRSTAMAD